jgi:hypothetical protein
VDFVGSNASQPDRETQAYQVRRSPEVGTAGEGGSQPTVKRFCKSI